MPIPLPTELIIKCLLEAEPSAIAPCRQVCHALDDIITESTEIQYKLRLAQASYLDVPTENEVSLAQRLSRLESHVRGWQDPQWKGDLPRPFIHEGSTYELQGGLFVAGSPAEDERATRGLFFWELPWRDRSLDGTPIVPEDEVEQNVLVHKDLGVNVHDFQVDPMQDLMILVETMDSTRGSNIMRVHFRSITDNKPHPLSQVPTKTIEIPPSTVGWPVTPVGLVIQIMDDTAAILVGFRGNHVPLHPRLEMLSNVVEVMNWKTGQTHCHIEGVGIDSLVFLDQDTIMFPQRVYDGTFNINLVVYRYSRSVGLEPILRPSREFPLPSRGADYLATLLLRRTPDNPGCHISPIIARCEPGMSFRTTPPQRSSWMKSPAKTYRPSPEARLLTLTFFTFQHQVAPPTRHFTVALLTESILKIALETSVKSEVDDFHVPWSEWGPQNTRWFEMEMLSSWICYTYGSRFVYLESGPKPGDIILHLLDFNPKVVKALEQGDKRDSYFNIYRTVTTRDAIEPGTTWTAPIHSELPYLDITSKVTFARVSSVMIDDERVILMVIDSNGRQKFRVFNV